MLEHLLCRVCLHAFPESSDGSGILQAPDSLITCPACDRSGHMDGKPFIQFIRFPAEAWDHWKSDQS